MGILIGVLVLALIALVGAAALVIAQSGSPQQTRAGQPTSTPLSHVTATTTLAPTGTPSPTPASACTPQGGTSLTVQGLGVMDFMYPKVLLPDTVPLKPLPVDQAKGPSNFTIGNSIPMSVGIKLPAAPGVGTICQISVRIIAFQALASAANVWASCDRYENPGGVQGGGCGGGNPGDGQAAFTFSSAQVGTTLTAPLVSETTGQPPTQISSTSLGHLDVDIQVPTPGTYTFQVGLWQDTSGPKWSNVTLTQMILFTHIAHLWSGQACTTADMQALLPAPTDPPGLFICPGGPPQ